MIDITSISLRSVVNDLYYVNYVSDENTVFIIFFVSFVSSVVNDLFSLISFQVIPLLYNMEAMLFKIRMKPEASFEKDFAVAMLAELARRYPSNGTRNDVYCFAHILHPFFRGNLIRAEHQNWWAKLDAFVNANEVEQDEAVDLDEAVIEEDNPEQDDFFNAAEQFSQTQGQAPRTEPHPDFRDQRLTPLKQELSSYFTAPGLSSSKIDVLAWWKSQQVILRKFRLKRS
jgi:hypothetical protein